MYQSSYVYVRNRTRLVSLRKTQCTSQLRNAASRPSGKCRGQHVSQDSLPKINVCIQIIRRFTTAQRYTKMPHYSIGAALKNLKGAMFFVGPGVHGCAKFHDGFGRHDTKG